MVPPCVISRARGAFPQVHRSISSWSWLAFPPGQLEYFLHALLYMEHFRGDLRRTMLARLPLPPAAATALGDNKINYRGLAQTQCAHLDRFFCAVRVVQLALLSPYPKVRARARPNATLRAHFPASLANFAHLTRTSRPPLTPRLRAAQTTPFVFCGRFYRYARAQPRTLTLTTPQTQQKPAESPNGYKTSVRD
jgi:hypothetical protein